VDVNLDSTIYASNVTMGATGVAEIPNIIIPFVEDEKDPYELKITGDINSNIANDNGSIKIDIEQQAQVGLKVRAITNNPALTVSGIGTISLPSNIEYNPGQEPILNFSLTASTSDGPISENATIDATSFTPDIPSPNVGDEAWDYSLQSISQTLNNPTNDEFSVTGSIIINVTGDTYITHTVDLDTIISTPSAVTYDSAVAVDDCNDTEGVASTFTTIPESSVVVGGSISGLTQGTYRLSNGLTAGNTYDISLLIVSSYTVTVDSNSEITNINQCT